MSHLYSLWYFYLYVLISCTQCPLHYTLEGILLTQFHDNDNVILEIDGVTTTTVSAYTSEFFGGKYKYGNRGYDIMALLLFIVAFRALFFYASAYVRHETR